MRETVPQERCGTTVTVLARLLDSGLLLLPGAITAAGFLVLSANGFNGIGTRSATDFLLFVPWQTLGLTAAKFGVDAWVLSTGRGWAGASLSLTPLMLTRTLPVAILAAVLVYSGSTGMAAFVAAASILADVIALVLASEMSAHGHIRSAALSHFLRYPLFFLLVAALGEGGRIEDEWLYLLFLVSSIARLVFLLILRPKNRTTDTEKPPTGRLALQQILNYGLFKNDQLAFAGISADAEHVRHALTYLVRFPEIVSAIVVSLGPVIYPYFQKRLDSKVLIRVDVLTWVVAISAVFLCLAAFGYVAYAPTRLHIAWYVVGALVLHGAMILPVNNFTFNCFASGRNDLLIAALLKANLSGIAIAAIILSAFSHFPMSLLMIVPIQQMIFLYFVGRGHPR